MEVKQTTRTEESKNKVNWRCWEEMLEKSSQTLKMKDTWLLRKSKVFMFGSRRLESTFEKFLKERGNSTTNTGRARGKCSISLKNSPGKGGEPKTSGKIV